MKNIMLLILLLLFLSVRNTDYSQCFADKLELPSETHKKSSGMDESIKYPDKGSSDMFRNRSPYTEKGDEMIYASDEDMMLRDWRPNPEEGDESGLGVNENPLPVENGMSILFVLAVSYILFIYFKRLKNKKKLPNP